MVKSCLFLYVRDLGDGLRGCGVRRLTATTCVCVRTRVRGKSGLQLRIRPDARPHSRPSDEDGANSHASLGLSLCGDDELHADRWRWSSRGGG